MERSDLRRLEDRFSQSILRVTDKWVKECRPHGILCGQKPNGSGCTRCWANGTPGPMREIAEAELADQPEGVDPLTPMNIPYINWRHYRFIRIPRPGDGIHRGGWYRKWNGKWVWAIWNEIDPDNWKEEVQTLLDNDLRLCKYDPDIPRNSTDDYIDRGPGLYITTELDGGESRNVTDTPDLMSELNGDSEHISAAVGDVELSPRQYTCANPKCKHHGPMRRVRNEDGGGKTSNLRCTVCGAKKKNKKKR